MTTPTQAIAGKSNDEYALLDTGRMKKLETVGPYTLVRPAPQAVWEAGLGEADWRRAEGVYTRDTGEDGGRWTFHKKVQREFDLIFGNLNLRIKLTNFGHMGLFPEQAANWDWMRAAIRRRLERTNNRNLYVLNLFGYTGGSTLACSQAGAHLVHVDAAKGVVDWARKNAQLSSLEDRPIRWLVDDALKFVQREERRGNSYQAIILDPPTFGRGPKGEVFKIEDDLVPLLQSCRAILAKDALFVLYSCHTPGFTPITMANQLAIVTSGRGGKTEAAEMVVPEQGRDKAGARLLPSGVYARWLAED
jgi:23S rRNA (cytosine1962-C5)-methyltransferase